MFENGGHIHVYSPGAGADNPVVIFFFIITIIKSSKSFASPLNDFVTVFPQSSV